MSLGILALAALAALTLHVLAGTTFPNPWPDEIDFMTPAAQRARHFTFDAPQLSAPHGMLWEPELMYFFWAPVLRFAPLAVESGRWVSFVMMLVAGGGFFVAGRRAGVPPLAASVVVALWLVNPLAILAGNIARPEAMVMAFVAWSAAATLDGRRALALALAVFACGAHAAGVPFALVLAVPNLFRRGERPQTRRGDWIAVGLAGAFVAFEFVHFLSHLSVALDQLHFQAEVHSHVTHGHRSPYIVATVVLAAALVALRRRLEWRALLLGWLAVPALVVLFVGWEQWYDVYALAMAPLLVAFVAIIGVRTLFTDHQITRLATALVAGLFGVFVIPPTTQPQFEGMQFRRHPNEWPAFERRVRAELLRIDAAATRPTTVLTNDVSGLPWPLEGGRVGTHVLVVKQTLVTRPIVPYQYALWIPGHRPPPRGRVITRIYSPHRLFTAILVRPATH